MFSRAHRWELLDLRTRKQSDGIPIDWRIVCHKSFVVRLGNSMPTHDVLEVGPEKHLSIFVLILKNAASDGHDALVGFIVNVAGHGGPLGDAFDMVRRDPNMLDIPAGLIAPNQVDPTTRANLGHLENKNFVYIVTLAWELIPLG